MGNVIGLFAVIPAMILLTVSFFVLFTARKAEPQALKTFGYVIAVLLWVSSALVFGTGIYIMSIGRCPMMKGRMMGGMMQQQGKRGKMPASMMKGQMMKGPMTGAGIKQGMDKQGTDK